MNDDSKTILGCIGALVLVVGGIILSAFLNGYVLVKLWEWFIMPTFESAPEISIPVAIGIGIIASLLTHQTTNTKSDGSGAESFIRFGIVVFLPLLSLLMGWIVYQFV